MPCCVSAAYRIVEDLAVKQVVRQVAQLLLQIASRKRNRRLGKLSDVEGELLLFGGQGGQRELRDLGGSNFTLEASLLGERSDRVDHAELSEHGLVEAEREDADLAVEQDVELVGDLACVSRAHRICRRTGQAGTAGGTSSSSSGGASRTCCAGPSA